MTQYSTLNVKLLNSQLNRLKSGTKNVIEIVSNLSSNVIGNSSHETIFLHKLLLTNTQVSRIRKAFANGSSANIRLSKNHLPKMVQLGGSTILPSLIEDSIADLFLSGLAKKKLVNPKEDFKNLTVDAGFDAIGKKIKKDLHQLQVQE